jgi:ankyrin repeat protein
MHVKRKSKRKIKKENIDGMFSLFNTTFNDPIYNLYNAIKDANYVECEILLKDNNINPNSVYKDFPLLYWVFVFMQKSSTKKIKNIYIDIYTLFLRYNVNVNQLIYYEYINRKIRVSNYIPLISIFSILNLVEYVELLLKNSEININFIDKTGNTPLIYAASNGYKNIVKLLATDKRINIFVQNDDYTASDYAGFNKHFEIQKYLSDLMRKKIDKILDKIDGNKK